MLSERLGCSALDCGMPMLSMHSIRGLTGSHEPRIGVEFFRGFFERYEVLREELGGEWEGDF
jgi:aminopeptidase I